MPKQIVPVPVLSEALSHAPLSLVTRAGNFVYVSGTPPYSHVTGELVVGDIRTQTREALASLEACLTAAGAKKSDVVNIRIYCSNAGWYSMINEVYAQFFGTDFPSRTFVPVASWPAQFDLEIDCVAYLDDSRENQS
ncbi:2-iminobutanoate/2-iminopropanoate deaminase [Rhodococcus sp. 27YEA15]|uniref:RidA family protein n=1 Tax=Rhodococcus sp. 27YEA15 TaxID=3156259 RepID=UPI003C79A4F7